MKTINQKILLLVIVLGFLFPIMSTVVVAADPPADLGGAKYTLLEPLPNISHPNGPYKTEINFGDYMTDMFNLIIALAAAAAVFMIVLGGFQYMTTDSWSGKTEGMNKVKNALLGLLLVLSSYLLLQTVDPRLVNIPSSIVKPLNVRSDHFGDDMFFNNLRNRVPTNNEEMRARADAIDAAAAKCAADETKMQELETAYNAMTDKDSPDARQNRSDFADAMDDCKRQRGEATLQEIFARYDRLVYELNPSAGGEYTEADPDTITGTVFDNKLRELQAMYSDDFDRMSVSGEPDQIRHLNDYRKYSDAMIKLKKAQSFVYEEVRQVGNNWLASESRNLATLNRFKQNYKRYSDKISTLYSSQLGAETKSLFETRVQDRLNEVRNITF